MSRLSRLPALLGSWAAYWLILAIVKLGPAISAIATATSGAPGTGSVDASMGNGALTLKVVHRGATLYNASASVLSIALWVAVPPLVFWILWIVFRGKATSEQRSRLRT